MKVLITSDLFSTATNGVVTSLTNLWKELEKLGHEVRILAVSDTTHSRQEDNVYFIRSMPFPVYPDVRMPLSYHHKLIKELIEWKPDVVHSQCEFFSYQFAEYVSKKTGAPIVHTYHTLYEQYVTYVIPSKTLGEKAIKKLMRVRLKKAARVIAPSHKVKGVLEGYHMDNTLSVIPSGISIEQHQYRMTEEERFAHRREWGIADDETVLLNLGRLGEEKNVAELLRYYAAAIKEIDKLRFMIVGGGPAKESLEKLTASLGLQDKVIFTGMVPPDTVQQYYQLGDVFVSASTSETQGLTYVEAAANGLPLLCREDLCLVGVIEEGENGYQYRDEAGFIDALKRITADPTWRESAARKSEIIAASFDKATFAKAIEELYLSVLEESK